MSSEINPLAHGEAAKVAGEVTPRLPLRDSIVIFGARITGAERFADEFSAAAAEHGLPSEAVQWTRHAEGVPDVFFGHTVSYGAGTVPRGVIAFPYMRQDGTTIETTRGNIDELCEAHGVPLIWAEQTPDGTAFSLPDAIGQLLTPPPEQPQIQG